MGFSVFSTTTFPTSASAAPVGDEPLYELEANINPGVSCPSGIEPPEDEAFLVVMAR